MSQKSTRRARRQTNDEDSTAKAPTPKPNGTEESPPILEEAKAQGPTPPPEETPPELQKEVTENETQKSPEPPEEKITNGTETEDMDISLEEKMDPLVVTDEPDPELVFEENSDLESGRESPVLSRCKTRRSLTRNIPTPKTPKGEEDLPKIDEDTPKMDEDTPEDSRDGEEPREELNVTFESCSENVSTKVQVGGDSTRLSYTESNFETNSFLQEAKNKSFGETLRRLSTRRTIRPISDDYRKRLLMTNLEKGDFVGAYPSRNSVERVSAVGIKRKNSEGEEEFIKRFKSDSPGFFTRFTSPLASIRNTFRGDIPSSTPKLTGYKDEKCLLEEDGINSQMHEVKDGERRWCSIM